ncbi:hypothetical protein EON83_22645 [bacterium]|nr:MAG: hypothetical protein EON83_22645 [bacterium]
MWKPFRSPLIHIVAFAAAIGLAPSLSVTAQAQSTPSNLQLLDKALDKAPDSNRVAIDDMLFPRANFLAYRNKVAQQDGRHLSSAFYNTTRWTGGNVYYSFDASLPTNQRTAFLDACAEWEKWVNVKFTARSTQANYINVYQDANNSSYSYIGMVGGSQQMSLAPWATKWTACHEIAHALGAMHEQCRSDRDSYVTINLANVQSGTESNFAIISDSINKGSYDFDSVMHYFSTAFAIDSSKYTIVCKPDYTQYQDTMGQREYLSALDKAGMVAIYGAPVSYYALSGTVTVGTAKLSGALITLNGGQTATSNTSGIFSFPSLAAGTYTLTPSKTGYTFSPTSRQINLSGNVTTANFAATAVATPTPTPTPTKTPTPTPTPTTVPITISAPSIAMVESNAGAPYMSFNISLSEPAKQTITVNFTTVDGTATAGSDYVARSGTLTFKAGSIISEVRITLIPDRIVEANETFSVVLSNPTGATLYVATGKGTIVNDDKTTSKEAPPTTVAEPSAPDG